MTIKYSPITLVSFLGIGGALLALTAQAQSTSEFGAELISNNATAPGSIHHAEFCCDTFDSPRNFSSIILEDVLATDLSTPNGDQIASFIEALNITKSHINGVTQLTAAQLVTVNGTLNENISALVSDRDSMVIALELVALYENQYGGFFSRGTTTEGGFSKTADGFELENLIIDVMQGLVDHSYSRPNIRFFPNVFRDKQFQTADVFPGAVDKSFNTFHEVRVNGTHIPKPGTRNLYWREDARRPTGTYLAPGSIASIKVPNSLINRGVSILVGGHTYDFSSGTSAKSDYRRMDRISTSFEIDNPIMLVANPLGGAIYLNIPFEQDHGIVDIEINNAVSMPYFARTVANQTSLADWVDTIRNHPAPYAIIESDKFMYETPSIFIRNYDNPEATLRDWDHALDAISELYARASPRSKTMLYIQLDRSPRAPNFAPGYPQSHSSFDSLNATPSANPLTSPFLAGPKEATGGTLPIVTHETGHGERNHLFRNELEASVMVPWIAIQNRKFGLNLDDAMVGSFHTQHLNIDQAAILWAVTEQFRNNESMPGTSHFYNWGRWPEIARLHGWDVIEDFYQWLSDEADKGNHFWWHANAREEQDRMIMQMATATGIDLTPLLHFWGIVPYDLESVKAQIAVDSSIEKSRPIYDQLLRYRDMIPVNNSQFREFAIDTGIGRGTTVENIVNYSGTRDNWGDGFYNLWWDDYTDREGEAARAQVDNIINTWFPDGRPAETLNVAATVYEHGNLSGYNVRLEVGEYPNLDSTILNDQISALRVASGYEVVLYENENFSGNSIIITPQSDSSLVSTFDDIATSAKVYATDDKVVKLYAGSNYSGAAWSIGLGTTPLYILHTSPVGNDNISSIEIPRGYSVKLCTDGGARGVCKTYTQSVAQLESPMNDSVSHIEVGRPSIAGFYQRHPVQNNWHLVTIVEEAGQILWTNKAGISCPLAWRDGLLLADASCPYGVIEIGVEPDQDGGVAAIVIANETYTVGSEAGAVITTGAALPGGEADGAVNVGAGSMSLGLLLLGLLRVRRLGSLISEGFNLVRH